MQDNVCRQCGYVINPDLIPKGSVIILCPRCIRILDVPVHSSHNDESTSDEKEDRTLLLERGE
jgi:hypothetical protein